MSQFIYNGINLSLVKTNSVQRVPRFSDDRTEYLWTDFIIDINCILAPTATAYPVYGSMPEVTDVTIRSILMQPRQPLLYSEGGISILEIPSNLENGGAIDCEDGPIPMELTITRIAGSSLIFIRYVIKTSIIECPVGTFVSAIASSRYSRSETLDAQYRSTIITNGKAYFRSNVLTALATNADDFRAYLIPRPFLYYVRRQIFVNLEPNGIYMEFTAIDEEQFVDLGDASIPGTAGSVGITTMDLNYSVNLNPKGSLGFAGYTSTATVDCSAVGTRTANTWSMMQFLYSAAYNKFGNLANTSFTVGAFAKENIFRNEVALSLSFMYVPKMEMTIPDMTMAMKGYIGEPIAALPPTGGVNPQPPFGNGTRGMIPVELAASAFATACYTDPSQVGIDNTGATPIDAFNNNGLQQTNPFVLVYFAPDISPGPIYIQQDNGQERSLGNPGQSAYINYSIRSDFITDYGTVQAPIAASPNSSSLGNGSLGNGGGSLSDSSQPTSINFQLFQPMTRKTVSWVIERVGAVPEVPSPTVTSALSSNYTLMKAVKSPIGIELMPDGYTPIYRISGVYTYSLLNPVLDTDAIPFDIPAWVALPQSEYTQLIPTDFEDGIINNQVT